MNSRVKTLLILAFCLMAVSIFGLVNILTREEIPANSIAVYYENEIRYVELKALDLEDVSGMVANGRGEVKNISGKGISLYDIIEKAFPNYLKKNETKSHEIKVIADDEYSASLSYEEILEQDKAYILINGDASQVARLYVFGDKDSKRSVSKVKKIKCF